MSIQKRIIGYHVTTWVLILLVAMLSGTSEESTNIGTSTIRMVNYFTIFIGTFYLHYGFLVPKYLMSKRYLLYIPFFAINLLLYPVLYYGFYLILEAIFPELIGTNQDNTFELDVNSYLHFISQCLFVVIPAIAVRYAVFGRETQRKAKELADEKAKAELSALKAQSNPHFLFNAFNSLYALSIKKDERLPQILLKLSDMMRYMMDYSQKEKAALWNEVKLIEDYLEIQKLRLDEEFDLQFNQYGEISGHYLTPLVLLPLVENCFKHGDLSPEGYIHLTLKIEGNQLIFKTENIIEKRHETNGSGLANLKRLLLLKYDNDYKFDAKAKGNTFYTYLKVPLDDH